MGLDEVAAARAALDTALDAVEVARQAVRDAQGGVRNERSELHGAIVRALREGFRVVPVAAAAKLTREQVRRIARAGGIEAE